MHRIDRAWDVREHGVLVRYAADVVVMCASRGQADAALARLTALLAELGLEPKQAKTRIVQMAVGGEGFDFLGFHHRLVRSDGRRTGKHVTFLARWPTNKAMQHARDRIRELTDRPKLLIPVEVIVAIRITPTTISTIAAKMIQPGPRLSNVTVLSATIGERRRQLH